MKKAKKVALILSAVLMMFSEMAISPAIFNNSDNTVVAATHRRHRRHTRRHHVRRRNKAKIWTDDYKIVGNKRSKIFHVIYGHSYRMNRENAVFFKSKAAARAAGYRESKR
ncbi:sunset domain-containing protein [Lactobacillus helveticus]|uniref:sunset domain-containing protein n=1 Tax=Lactobacillus helveticus TaxID=1587 RepID=UPI001561BCB3|nr:Ada metal-binding domain-containing protein [Lactobacillus helveticus]NRN97572.1 hypothetical protein [Lactobacillus helveticus]